MSGPGSAGGDSAADGESFEDRAEAGRRLGRRLREEYGGRPDLLVLGLPRGGVPVAREVARALDAPLDVLVVRKLGVPSQPELAFGAIAGGGERYVDRDMVRRLGLSEEQIEEVTAREREELRRREDEYRGGRREVRVEGRTVLVVDDGVATGATLQAALRVLREADAGRIVVAVPVAPSDSLEKLAEEADEVVCLRTPEPFFAISPHYRSFPQTSDDEVRRLLREAPGATDPGTESGPPGPM